MARIRIRMTPAEFGNLLPLKSDAKHKGEFSSTCAGVTDLVWPLEDLIFLEEKQLVLFMNAPGIMFTALALNLRLIDAIAPDTDGGEGLDELDRLLPDSGPADSD